MGKTSILYFVETNVPDHVFPVYINLERGWSAQGASTLWDYLTTRLLEQAKLQKSDVKTTVHLDSRIGATGFVAVTHSICNQLRKEYVLLLFDEFNNIFKLSDEEVHSILSELRGFHDDPRNHISLLIADRLTRQELEKRLPHDLWAQLTSQHIGPLDLDAVSKVLLTPPLGAEQSDVLWLSETIQRVFELTAGYPYHIVRIAHTIVENRLSRGPWLVALPQDVDEAAENLLLQDNLFQIGLCRPDRIDDLLEEAIASLLQWDDLLLLLPELRKEDQWQRIFQKWRPDPRDFLISLDNPEEILNQLAAISVTRKTDDGYVFFSSLFKQWLRKMRDEGRGLTDKRPTKEWGLIKTGDGSKIEANDWQELDSKLIRCCVEARVNPPLKQHALPPEKELWSTLVSEVAGKLSFDSFLDAIFKLFVDQREDKTAIQSYPRLCLVYHQIRLVRNYHKHNDASKSAINAWNQICSRALRKRLRLYTPVRREEWAAIQAELLRDLYAGLNNAIAIVTARME